MSRLSTSLIMLWQRVWAVLSRTTQSHSLPVWTLHKLDPQRRWVPVVWKKKRELLFLSSHSTGSQCWSWPQILRSVKVNLNDDISCQILRFFVPLTVVNKILNIVVSALTVFKTYYQKTEGGGHFTDFSTSNNIQPNLSELYLASQIWNWQSACWSSPCLVNLPIMVFVTNLRWFWTRPGLMWSGCRKLQYMWMWVSNSFKSSC